MIEFFLNTILLVLFVFLTLTVGFVAGCYFSLCILSNHISGSYKFWKYRSFMSMVNTFYEKRDENDL
jgi:amino acid transporter